MTNNTNKYIVRQPIKNIESKVVGYEIMYYGANEAYGGDDANNIQAAEAIYNVLTQNSGKGLRASINFMTFTTTLLAKRTPRLFSKSDLVIQIDDSVIIHPFAMHLVQQYAKEGYRIAVNDFQFQPRYLGLMDYLTYIKIDLKSTSRQTAENILRVASSMNKRTILTGVDTSELYDIAVELEPNGMQGAFVAEKMSNKAHRSSYLRSNFFRLVVEITKDEPDIDEVQRLISMDATLTYSILKLANSVYFARRQKTTSVKQAIITLGLGQLKRWIYLLSYGDQSDEDFSNSEEFLKLSLIRADFCSRLANELPSPLISQSEAYLLGMFSTLEYLIDAPMEEILEDIPMEDDMRQALLTHSGKLGDLLMLVIDYERADWNSITEKANSLGIPSNRLTTLYFDCMEEISTTWEQLSQQIPERPAEEEAQE